MVLMKESIDHTKNHQSKVEEVFRKLRTTQPDPAAETTCGELMIEFYEDQSLHCGFCRARNLCFTL